VGALIGTLLAGRVLAANRLAEPADGFVHDWQSIWSQPAWGAAVVLGVFLLSFRGPGKPARVEEPLVPVMVPE